MTTIEKKTVKVGKFVDTTYVDTLIRNYKQERWAQNSERIGKEDSLSVWYSVEELEQFIEKIKMYGADGVKIYFGAYSSDFAENPAYADRQTLVLVGTKANTTAAGVANKDIYVNTGKGNSILAYNYGQMCPPNCSNGGPIKPAEPAGDEWGGIGVTIVDRGDKGVVIV
ncbi:hypothetical protein HB364_07435 [Pseudoflavitalea sp. X16]|uniref:hypothetical protein n=1 Tax=Paraflavitalea devenefica TaxID=2716334 RepID=UPI0014227A7C|nr:hypothetical protein [Paraflavitalea devenefica]NII24904.1 hypothetical protein [Paraflavitalea devenefica]